MKSNAKVLIIGSGGREHAFAWSLSNDKNVEKVYCAPGNGGTKKIAKNIDLDISDCYSVVEYVKRENIDLTIVGPEGPLANGIVDVFKESGIPIFGPDKYATQLESSKLFARKIMSNYNIPIPKYFACRDKEEADKAKELLNFPLVLKADGLAAGKGVIICNSEEEYQAGIDIMFEKNIFGEASSVISVEECLEGDELSMFAVCDGKDYVLLNSAQDYKRIYEGDKGPNTGGMGAYSPTYLSTDEITSKTKLEIIEPILKAMRDENHPFVGFLYVGLMVVENNPYVIEFNVRMGDPETQVVLPLLESSLYELLWNASKGEIKKSHVKLSDKTAVSVVLASKGYPNSYKKGMEIFGIDDKKLIFHAGTKVEGSKIFSNGGRVLNVVGFGENLQTAIDDAYLIAENISYENIYYRKDIGKKGICKD